MVGIPPAPRGVPQVEVMFEIDANGIVNVSARDKMTGLEQAMQITPSSGLAPDEIEHLIMEAETSTELDKQTKQLINERNRLDSLIKNARRALQEFGRSLTQNQQMQLNEILNDSEEALKSETLLEVTSAANRVEEAANKLTEALMATVS